MKLNETESAWRQHYPTYDFKDKDVALEEYRSASKALESDERVFINAANIAIVIGAAFGTLALGRLKDLTESLTPQVPVWFTLSVVLSIAMASGVIFLRHFADRQKSIVYAARKVIVIRRMLGMSYGRLQLVLPNWRIEGADDPFSIKLFPGWNTYIAFPCYAIAGISSVVVLFVTVILLDNIAAGSPLIFGMTPLLVGSVATAFWFLCQCWLYRKALFDTHERTSLILARHVAKILRVQIDNGVEYTIYRARLSVHELQRLKIDLTALEKMAIQIEDKEFFSHRGVSWRGLARMVLSSIKLSPRSGGSTIAQQLVRTLFISGQQQVWRRKIVELILAVWITSVLSKKIQLEMYLASVRFEYKVIGIAAAYKYFFGGIVEAPSPAQAFFLIERLSNVRSRILGSKIKQTLSRAMADGLMTENDALEVVCIYKDMVRLGLIHDQSGSALKALQS